MPSTGYFKPQPVRNRKIVTHGKTLDLSQHLTQFTRWIKIAVYGLCGSSLLCAYGSLALNDPTATTGPGDCRPYQPSFEEFKQVLDKARETLTGSPDVESVCAFITLQTLNNPPTRYTLSWPESFDDPLSIRLIQLCQANKQGVHCDPPNREASLDDLSWIKIPGDLSARQINEFIGLATQRARPGETIAAIDYAPALNSSWSVEKHGYAVVLHRVGLKHTRTLYFTRNCKTATSCHWQVDN